MHKFFGCSRKKWADKWGLKESYVKCSLARGYSFIGAKAPHDHPLYKTYESMIYRCYDSNFHDFRHYGGRGIYVCARWFYSFQNFADDMGNKPKGYSIDRIDCNGIYEPSNCRWANQTTQINNRRCALSTEKRDIIFQDRILEKLSYRKIAEKHKISYGLAYKIATTHELRSVH